MSDAENYAIRIGIYKNGVNQLSDCSGGFGYVNKSASNYEAYAAGLLTNYYQGKPVILYVVHDANGFCRISDYQF